MGYGGRRGSFVFLGEPVNADSVFPEWEDSRVSGNWEESSKCAPTTTWLETQLTSPHRTHSSICDHFGGWGGGFICIFTGHLGSLSGRWYTSGQTYKPWPELVSCQAKWNLKRNFYKADTEHSPCSHAQCWEFGFFRTVTNRTLKIVKLLETICMPFPSPSGLSEPHFSTLSRLSHTSPELLNPGCTSEQVNLKIYIHAGSPHPSCLLNQSL